MRLGTGRKLNLRPLPGATHFYGFLTHKPIYLCYFTQNFNDLKSNRELIKVCSVILKHLILFPKGIGHFGLTLPPIFRGLSPENP